MICGCDCIEDSKTHTDFPISLRAMSFEEFLVIPKLAFFDSRGGEKNYLRGLRQESPVVLRSQVAQGARSVLRRYAHLPGDRGPTRPVQELWQGEDRRAFVAGRQSVLHQTLRLLCRPSMPVFDDPRRSQRTASGLEDGQRARQAIHARTTAQDRDARPANHRDRRSFDPKGTQL
jgi:hypothetical protein